jgi:hemolysin activation/secretion protein
LAAGLRDRFLALQQKLKQQQEEAEQRKKEQQQQQQQQQAAEQKAAEDAKAEAEIDYANIDISDLEKLAAAHPNDAVKQHALGFACVSFCFIFLW